MARIFYISFGGCIDYAITGSKNSIPYNNRHTSNPKIQERNLKLRRYSKPFKTPSEEREGLLKIYEVKKAISQHLRVASITDRVSQDLGRGKLTSPSSSIDTLFLCFKDPFIKIA